MKLLQYKNGLVLKRKNKRTRILKSLKNPDHTFLEFKIYSKEGYFAGFSENRGVQTAIVTLTDETLIFLSKMIIQYLEENRK